MTRLALLLAALAASPAAATDTWSPGASVLRIMPGATCVAEVQIFNVWNDNKGQTNSGVLTLGGLVVKIETFIGDLTAPDTFTAIPPHGYIAVPPSLTLQEETGGTILICAKQGVGA